MLSNAVRRILICILKWIVLANKIVNWSLEHHNCLLNCQKCTWELPKLMCNNYIYDRFWSIVQHIFPKLSVIKKSLQQRWNLKIVYCILIYSESKKDAHLCFLFLYIQMIFLTSFPILSLKQYTGTFLDVWLNFFNTKLSMWNQDR